MDKDAGGFRAVTRIWKNYPIFLAAVLIGVLAYLLGRGSHWAFSSFEALCRRFPWWPFFSLPAGGVALTWFMRRVGPGTEGSGIQQAVAAMHVVNHGEQVRWLLNLRLAAAKFAAIVVGMGSGFVLGLEGPTVQIGASVMYAFKRLFPHANPALRSQLIMAGGAAGISAAFHAPMAGMMFAFEELGHAVFWHASVRVMMSVVLSGAAAYVLRGTSYFFENMWFFRSLTLPLIAVLLAVTVAGSLFGSAFAWLAVRANRWLPAPVREFRKRRPYGFVAACSLLIALIGMVSPIFGSGIEETGAVLRGAERFPWHYAPCKMLGLLLTVLAGVPGGVFSPSLALGAGVGSWFVGLGPAAWHSDIIAVGMAACLAAVTRAPLTAAVIIAEMTGAHSIMLVAMGASLLSAQIARYNHVRFYHNLAVRALKTMPERLGGARNGRISLRMRGTVVKHR